MRFSKSRLFITFDIYSDNTWYVRTEYEKFARIKIVEGMILIWFYPFKHEVMASTVTEALEYIEKRFSRYYYDNYYNEE